MAEGATHISCHHKNTIEGNRRKQTDKQTRTNLGLTKSDTTCTCIPDSRYGLTLAWVTSENSTMLLESDILRLFFTGPYLVSSPLCSVSGVDCPSALPRQLLLFASLLSSRNSFSPVQPPTLLSWVASSTLLSSLHCLFSALQPPTPSLVQPQLPSLLSSHQLSFASPYHFRIRRDFMSKNPLSGFAPKQTRLLWRPTHIVLQFSQLASIDLQGDCTHW